MKRFVDSCSSWKKIRVIPNPGTERIRVLMFTPFSLSVCRAPEEVKLSSTMASNIPTSREYGRFTLPNPRHSATTLNTSRDGILEPERYQPNGNDTSFRHAHSPRPLTRISDYLNEKPLFPPPYVPPSSI